MGWLDGIGSFISDNSSWLKPVLNIGSGLYKDRQASGNQSNYLSLLREQEDRNFADTLAYNDAARQYNEQAAAMANANAASRAAAARANSEAERGARNKAAKQMDKVYQRNIEAYKPFKDTALTLLPKMSDTYQNSLNQMNLLSAYLSRPENMGKLEASKPQWAVGAPLPSWAKKK